MTRRRTRRRRFGGRASRRGSPVIIAIAALILASLALVTFFGGELFAMAQVGDAFKGLTAVEFDGFYMRVRDCGKKGGSTACTAAGASTVTYTEDGKIYTTKVSKTLLISTFPKGLYVTPSGYMVQIVKIGQAWLLGSHVHYYYRHGQYDKFQAFLEGHKIKEAWVYIQLDASKFMGGRPILVALDEESLQGLLREHDKSVSYYWKVSQAAAEGRGYSWGVVQDTAIRLKLMSTTFERILPFEWFPENGTIRFKLTGLTGAQSSGELTYLTYIIYIGPPEGKVYTCSSKVSVITTKRSEVRTINVVTMDLGYTTKVHYFLQTRWTVKTLGTETRYFLVMASGTPANLPMAVEQEVVAVNELNVATTTTTATFSGVYVPSTTVIPLQEVSTTTVEDQTIERTVTRTVTVEAPRATVTVTEAGQAPQVASMYTPPKPLAKVIYEKLVEFWNWLLSLFGFGGEKR